MAVAGIDAGSLTTKVVVLNGGQIVGKSILTGQESAEVCAKQAMEEALRQAGLSSSDLKQIVVTGAGKKEVSFAQKQKATTTCLGKGMNYLSKGVRTVFDVGAECSTVVRLNDSGGVMDSVGQDHCASGTGTFLDAMAKLMQMPLEEMAKLSLRAERRAEISNTCAVFAESEVISHVHRVPPTPKPDIIAGIHGSMAVRIVGLAKRIGIKPEVALCGGVARNIGFATVLEQELKLKVFVPEEPQLVAALGAALSAQSEGDK